MTPKLCLGMGPAVPHNSLSSSNLHNLVRKYWISAGSLAVRDLRPVLIIANVHIHDQTTRKLKDFLRQQSIDDARVPLTCSRNRNF